jgi:hypothetical protein
MSFRSCKLAALAVWLICALGFFAGHLSTGVASTAPVGVPSASGQVKEIEGYKGWTKVNAVPQLMPSNVSTACAVALPPGANRASTMNNPHRDKYFTVYVNDVGREAMLNQKSPKFPVGSVIVKEKLSSVESRTPELLTVMIKQKPGFNPASGDWEYMVLDGAGAKVEGRGDLKNCQACHVANQTTDYVFRTYLSGEIKTGLK